MIKRKNGFTLIELLAVIVILGVIMTIAVPNIIATLDRNKKESFIEDAKQMISAAEYKIKSDTSIEYPDLYSVTILKLEDLDSIKLETSSFDTYYSQDKSFVAIVKEPVAGTTDYEYQYLVHLVSCTDKKCANLEVDSAAYNRGINLQKLSNLDTVDRFDFVVKGSEVKKNLIDDIDGIKSIVVKDNVNIY